MNEKEIGEIRRRFRPEKSCITHVRGCYINANREIISQFDQSIAMMSQEEGEKFLALLRRTLTGAVGKNLLDVSFSTKQVLEGEEHRLLMALRTSELGDEEAVRTFFQKAMESITLEDNYLILLASDAYDVPHRGKDGEVMEEASEQVYRYILCAVCPVKQTKPALSYHVKENSFQDRTTEWLVSPPELGFLFPAFEERAANLYHTLYYTRDGKENHPAFAKALFGAEVPLPAAEQKETFRSLLGESLEEECRFDVVQAVQEELRSLVIDHKERKEPEPLVISRDTVRRVLEDNGVSQERSDAFDQAYDAAFGAEAALSPGNLVDLKCTEIRTGAAVIQVDAQREDLIEMRRINGARYVLVRAEEEITVNGVPINIE